MLKLVCKTKGRKGRYICQCGTEFEAFVYNVKSGHTQSCGCVRRQANSDRFKTHGHKSGGRRSRAYVAWVNMKGRCNNGARQDAANYVGRGISYCARWGKFENFLADMGEPGPKLSLDRIDNSKGYNKKNCRWATSSQQNQNKRNCVRYEFKGKTMTLGEWAKELGIKRLTLFQRLRTGWSIEMAFTLPPNSRLRDATNGLVRIA